MSSPDYPLVSTKKFNPFDPAVWPAIYTSLAGYGNIYTNVLFYYIDRIYFLLRYKS